MTPARTDIADTAVLQYTVKPESLEEHLDLLRDVYAELQARQPAHFTWATYQVAGSRRFVEIASGRPLPGPLPDLPSFRRFRAELDERCETQQFDDVVVVGSFPSD